MPYDIFSGMADMYPSVPYDSGKMLRSGARGKVLRSGADPRRAFTHAFIYTMTGNEEEIHYAYAAAEGQLAMNGFVQGYAAFTINRLWREV